jgi:hypothetical protein
MTAISGPWAAAIRSAIAVTPVSAARSGASDAISSACRWCGTIAATNATSPG